MMNQEKPTQQPIDAPLPSTTEPVSKGRPLANQLRFLGVSTLIASVATFLFRRWELVEDLPMYLQLLGVSVGLGLLGLLCTFLLKEERSARAFSGLLFASLPVNFAALGGLIYAVRDPAIGAGMSMPGALRICFGASVLLLPLVSFASWHLVRERWLSLTLSMLAPSAMLLLPIRDPIFVVLAFPALLLALMFVDRARMQDMDRMPVSKSRSSSESGLPLVAAPASFVALHLSRLALLIPFAVAFFRSVIHHSVDSAPFWFGWFLTGVFLVWHIRGDARSAAVRTLFEFLSLAPLLCAAIAFLCILDLPRSYASVSVGIAIGSFVCILALFVTRGFPLLMGFGAWCMATGLGMQTLFDSEPWMSVLAFAVGAGLLAVGTGNRQPFLRILGGLLIALTAIVEGSQFLFEIIDFSVFFLKTWWAYAILGGLLILLASFFDRKGSSPGRKFAAVYRRFRGYILPRDRSLPYDAPGPLSTYKVQE